MDELSLVGRWTLVLVTTLVLQAGLMSQITIGGVVPDLMVTIAVCAGLTGGAQRGAIVGFWAGLLLDLARPGPVGISALSMCLVAFAAGTVQVMVVQSGKLISMMLVAAASGLGVLVFAVGGEVFGGDTLTHPHLFTIVVVVALISGLLSRLGLRLAGWAEGPEHRSVAE
jgi:rod shape-determining protein MreD